ncbi:MAG: S-methyl-5-thioribose-1-phosphate isomerase [Myxococcota bacterium]
MRPLLLSESGLKVIDQRLLPHELTWLTIPDAESAAEAIRDMAVRGAPLIGTTAAFGLALALEQDATPEQLQRAYDMLLATRPTAINLGWALNRVRDAVRDHARSEWAERAFATAQSLVDEEAAMCRAIGEHSVGLIADLHRQHQRPINVLTHCNAGSLATFDYGTATAPIYLAHEREIPVHVWVDETRPRNQGASLTTWELAERGVPHTLIADNAGGHLMQHGEVDLCFVGADRVTRRGDACNKIGTYLKALAARDTGVGFYVCLPSSTIDWSVDEGLTEIPIEERQPREVTHMRGRYGDEVHEFAIAPPSVAVRNPAFDVTPARLITALVTERGVCEASEGGLLALFPDAQT